jgi:cyclophilin family peptidyl-prolyl cis-trans isomerase
MSRFGLALLSLGLLTLCLTGCNGGGDNPVVEIDTSYGKIKAELFQDKAPITVKNFLSYVDDKHFDGTIFHRVIPTFMIQGGGYESSEKLKKGEEKKTKDPIKNESYNGLLNKRGTLAMARTGKPDSATAQFFINVEDNDFLDKANARDKVGYAVFGKVIEGMDVVNKIKGVETQIIIPKVLEDVPVQDVVIKSIRRVEKK